MAGTFLRRPLSGSTDGKNIKIAAVATAGTLIHTAQADATLVDVVSLYACNTDTSLHRLTLEWGGVAAPDDSLLYDLLPGVFTPIIMDLVIRNSLVVRGFAVGAANLIVVNGFIHRES